MDYLPVPASLRAIVDQPLDVIGRAQAISAELKRLGVRAVYGRDIHAADYGRVIGVIRDDMRPALSDITEAIRLVCLVEVDVLAGDTTDVTRQMIVDAREALRLALVALDDSTAPPASVCQECGSADVQCLSCGLSR
jgi:hypothetical protein